MPKVQPTKEQISAMKRDTSRIFTVPEEKEGEIELLENGLNGFLPEMNGITKTRADITNVCTPGRGSTPMKDLNVAKFLHNKIMSICGSGGDSKGGKSETANGKSSVGDKIGMMFKSKEIHNKKVPPQCLVNYCECEVHSLSLNDLHKSRVSNKRIPIRYYSFGLPRLTRDMCSDDEASPDENIPPARHFFNTITDPVFPVFRADGVPISRYLFDEYVSQHYQLLEKERDSESSPETSKCEDTISTAVAGNSVNGTVTRCLKGGEKLNEGDGSVPKSEAYKRSLSLPLKTFDVCKPEGDSDVVRQRSVSYCEGDLKSPIFPKNPGSLQLTPLMNKLSLLALDENSTECKTPNEYADPLLKGIGSVTKRERRRLQPEVDVDVSAPPEEAVLYICGQQTMSLLLILQSEGSQDPELIHTLVSTVNNCSQNK